MSIPNPIPTLNPMSFQIGSTTFSLHSYGLTLIRPNAQSPLWLNLQSADTPDSWGGLGLDFANDGAFMALYSAQGSLDTFAVGLVGDVAGHVTIGCGPPHKEYELMIQDVGPNVKQSVNIYSNNDGITLDSKALSCDTINISRGSNFQNHWLCFSQGSRASDIRVGMDGSYNLVFYTGNANSTCSPSNPGEKKITIHNTQSGSVEFHVPIVAKEISDLQAQVNELKAQVAKLISCQTPNTISLANHP